MIWPLIRAYYDTIRRIMKDFTNRFYNHAAWMTVRDSYIAKRQRVDGGMCERCHDKLGYIVHHKIKLTPENIGDPAIALNQDLLEFVCLDCHNKEHGVFQPSPRRIIFDDDGNVIDVIDRKR